ncbi:MAG TPA: M48 family metalloprotease, partial [Azospirillum sp.]
ADARLAGRLQRLLERCGLRLAEVRVIDASRRTRRANASVVGFGSARRIMLHDTLLERLDADEIEAVVAHEAGHARHRHITRYLAGMGITGLAAFAALAWLGPALGASVGERLALFVLALPLVGLFLRPLAVAVLRGWEYQADAFAVRRTSAAALGRALTKLYAANANAPSGDPLHAAFHAAHPEPAQRLGRLHG